jgi:hypothetical protein
MRAPHQTIRRHQAPSDTWAYVRADHPSATRFHQGTLGTIRAAPSKQHQVAFGTTRAPSEHQAPPGTIRAHQSTIRRTLGLQSATSGTHPQHIIIAKSSPHLAGRGWAISLSHTRTHTHEHTHTHTRTQVDIKIAGHSADMGALDPHYHHKQLARTQTAHTHTHTRTHTHAHTRTHRSTSRSTRFSGYRLFWVILSGINIWFGWIWCWFGHSVSGSSQPAETLY